VKPRRWRRLRIALEIAWLALRFLTTRPPAFVDDD